MLPLNKKVPQLIYILDIIIYIKSSLDEVNQWFICLVWTFFNALPRIGWQLTWMYIEVQSESTLIDQPINKPIYLIRQLVQLFLFVLKDPQLVKSMGFFKRSYFLCHQGAVRSYLYLQQEVFCRDRVIIMSSVQSSMCRLPV